MTLYQAGNGIYNLFDKVLVLDGGKEVFYGPREEARPFMEELGFVCHEGSNVADFLTGVTVPTERIIRPDCETTFPRNAEMLYAEYQKSPVHARMIAEYDFPTSDEAAEKTRLFKERVAMEKDPRLPASSPLTAGFGTQVKACIIRQYQIIWGDKATFFVKQITCLSIVLIAGSLFYNAADDSRGLFLKGGALFFSLLFHTMLALAEVMNSFSGRPIMIKHRYFGYYHPAAFCIAQITSDIPVIFLSVSIFSVVLYFMVGLRSTAGAFFTYWVVLFASSMVSSVRCNPQLGQT